MSEYAERFAENRIDFSVLPDLTDQDLRDLGLALGDRRKMLRAIADLGGRNESKTAESAVATPALQPQEVAERRQVTVMFTDLVGSTALSTHMDPEDLRDVISAYRRCVAETVRNFGGFVSQYVGDGVLAYFGYPEAHEDDAERAVGASLRLVKAVADLKTGVALRARVGIATGLVVVGDLIGSGEAQERGIVGETPNLAARLQGIAEPDAVVIAEGTRRLLGNLFEFEDLGAKDLKGISGTVRVYAALRASSAEGRFEALHASSLTPLVGREEELELLLRRWSRSKTDEGQIVRLSGEAGIGKSRLTAALLERIADEPHTRLRYFCSPQQTDSAFYSIIGQMERAAGLAPDDTAEAKLEKLDAVLAQTSTSKHDGALFAELLSLPNDGRYPKLEMAPEQRRQKTLEALTAQLEALSRFNPVLMIFEDVQWIDPTSLEALGRTVDRLRTLGVLLLITFRPEFEPPWMERSYDTALTLNRLGEREIAAMIDGVTGGRPLPERIRQDIIERTDGIPLFVEEMTKAVLEAESEGKARQAATPIPPALAVPASLHASLMARLDRLGPGRAVAQVGAAIGREFSHSLLTAVVRKPERELESALDRLIQAGLLFRQGRPPHATYRFKHALVQDAAYATLLREPRRALNARIAETLESQFPQIAESQPQLLARYCTEAGLVEKAAHLWGKAGRRSVERSALIEAIDQFTRAVADIASLPTTRTLRLEQIKLHVALITPLLNIKGYAAAETKAATDRARLLIEQAEALGEPIEDPLLLFSVLYSYWAANYVAFNGEAMRESATQYLALAEMKGLIVPLMIGHRLMGSSLAWTGDLVKGRAHYDQAIGLYDAAEHRSMATRFGADPRVATLSFRSLTLWVLGYPEAALTDSKQALSDAREIGQTASLMFALSLASITHIHCGKYAAATAQLEEVITFADEKDALFWGAIGISFRGYLLASTGRASEAIDTVSSGLAAYRSTGTTLWMPLHLSSLAKANVDVGHFDGAWRNINEAMRTIEETKERWLEAEINRLAGEITLKSPIADAVKAEAYFERALTIARQQQAKSWELRAAMSMARLWRDQGKPQQARELLARVYDWFTEGFDTVDLKEAKVLLDELAS
jgi:class 3 adenylate cyclase/tetratricopeptide (TPR) repeat protein